MLKRCYAWPWLLMLLPGLGLAERTLLEYSIHADQFHVLDSHFEMDLRDGRYLLEGGATTTGLAGFFFPYEVTFWSAGALDGDQVSPGSFGNDARSWRGSRQVEMVYNERGPTVVALHPVPGDDDEREPVPLAMREGSIDPLSLLVLAIQRLSDTGSCPEIPQRVFDGRRLLALSFLAVDEPLPAELQPPKPPLGEVLACRLDAEQLAGHWKGKRGGWSAGPFQRRDEREEAPLVVWFGRLHGDMPFLPLGAERNGGWRVLLKLTGFSGLGLH